MTSSEDMKRLFWWRDNIEARVAALEDNGGDDPAWTPHRRLDEHLRQLNAVIDRVAALEETLRDYAPADYADVMADRAQRRREP